jgi:hypothetical protein
MFFEIIFLLLPLSIMTSHTFLFTVYLVRNMLCHCDCSICFSASSSFQTTRERDNNSPSSPHVTSSSS